MIVLPTSVDLRPNMGVFTWFYQETSGILLGNWVCPTTGRVPKWMTIRSWEKEQTSEAPQGFRQTQRYRAQCRTGMGGRLAHIPVLSLEEFTKPISSTGLCFNGFSLLGFLTAPGGLWVFDLTSGSRLQHSVENQWTQWTSSFSIETAWN
jgi:hypothetical protein